MRQNQVANWLRLSLEFETQVLIEYLLFQVIHCGTNCGLREFAIKSKTANDLAIAQLDV